MLDVDMHEAEVIVLESAQAFGGLRWCWLGPAIEAFGLEDAPDAVAVEMRQEMGNDKRQVIGILIRRPFNRLLLVADRWQTGDFAARTGFRMDSSEFGRLGVAFDAMAEALAKREQALHTALESTTDSVVVLYREWRSVYLNRRAVQQTA